MVPQRVILEVPGAAPEVLDRARAAELLGVSLATLRRLVTAGEVREHRLGDGGRDAGDERAELGDDPGREDEDAGCDQPDLAATDEVDRRLLLEHAPDAAAGDRHTADRAGHPPFP